MVQVQSPAGERSHAVGEAKKKKKKKKKRRRKKKMAKLFSSREKGLLRTDPSAQAIFFSSSLKNPRCIS